MAQRVFSTKQINELGLLPFSRQVLERKLRKGEIPHMKINGRYYLTEEHLKEYIESNN